MARTKKIITDNTPVEEELETLLTIPANTKLTEEKEESRFVITAKFKGLHLNGKIFDNMKVVLFECKAFEVAEAKQKFCKVIEKVFPGEVPQDFISRVFGQEIEIEEYKTLNKITTKFFNL